MENLFEEIIDKKRVAETLQDAAETFNCDIKTAWDKYTHEIIKGIVTFEEIEKIIKGE